MGSFCICICISSCNSICIFSVIELVFEYCIYVDDDVGDDYIFVNQGG